MKHPKILRLDPLFVRFDQERHAYQDLATGEMMAHSITAVTGRNMCPRKRAVIEKTKHVWEPRGNACHEAFANHLTGQPVVVGDYAAWLEPLFEHQFFDEFQPIAVEYAMADPSRSLGGAFDALGYWRDKLILVDLKTQSSKNAATYDTSPQLGGYLSLLNYSHPHLFIEAAKTLWARPGKAFLGKTQSIDQCDEAWADAWDIHTMYLKAESF